MCVMTMATTGALEMSSTTLNHGLMERRKGGMKMICKTCKKYSCKSGEMTSKGWCMKLRRTVKEDFFCAYYKPEDDGRWRYYEMQCKSI